MSGFIFGGNTGMTYEQLQSRRAIAERMIAANAETPQNVGEGLNAIGRAIAARMINRQNEKGEAQLRGAFEEQFNALFGGAGVGANVGTSGGGYASPSYSGGGGTGAGPANVPESGTFSITGERLPDEVAPSVIDMAPQPSAISESPEPPMLLGGQGLGASSIDVIIPGAESALRLPGGPDQMQPTGIPRASPAPQTPYEQALARFNASGNGVTQTEQGSLRPVSPLPLQETPQTPYPVDFLPSDLMGQGMMPPSAPVGQTPPPVDFLPEDLRGEGMMPPLSPFQQSQAGYADMQRRVDARNALLPGGTGAVPAGSEAVPGVALGSVSPETRLMLARTLQAEAGNQGYNGMLDVGSVIANRVASGQWGDTFEDVIMSPAQFSAWNSVTGAAGGAQGQDMSFQPNAEALAAADAILAAEYEDRTGGALNYYADIPGVSGVPSWSNDSFARIDGDHYFGTADGSSGGGPPRMGGGAPVAPGGGAPTMSGQGSAAPSGLTIEQMKDQGIDVGQPSSFASDDPMARIAALMPLLSNSMASEGQRMVLGALMQQEMQRMFPEPREPIEINGQLVDPVTYEVLADFRNEEEPDLPGSRREYDLYAADELAAGRQPMSYGDFLIAPERAGNPTQPQVIGGNQILVADDSVPEGYRLVDLPGSEAEAEAQTAAEAETRRAGMTEARGDVVLDAALSALESSRDRGFGGRGRLGQMIGDPESTLYMPGTAAAETYRQLETITALGQIETIQAMRAASPTGAALGAASDRDMRALGASIGALDPGSPNFERDLARVTRNLLRTVHGLEAGDAMFAQTPLAAVLGGGQPAPQGGAPSANDPLGLR